MVSLLKEQENFLRNAILTVDHSKEVLQCFIDKHLKYKHQTFEDFLNQNQHDIYHLYYDAKCCQCGPGPFQKKKRILFASQMELLFDKNRQLSVHKTTRRGDFCCCTAKTSVTTAVLDLTLARCLLMHCCVGMFWYSVLDFKGVTLEQFLNSNKHILYHLWKNNTKCCKCQPDFIFPCNVPLIMESEWNIMFSSTLPPCENDRKRPVNGPISICAFSATPSITVHQIHLELQGIIIQYCCSTRKSVEKLAELRNLTFGHAKKASMSCPEFNTFMSESEDAILDIATVCGNEDYYRQMLLDLRDKPLDTRMFRQYEKVLLQTISNYEDIIKENEVLNDGIESLKNSNEEMKEKIEKLCILQTEGLKRKRLIDETSAEIEIHEKDVTYVEIEAVRHCIQLLESRNVVILSGREGSGKSRNGLEILRQVKEKSKDFDVFKLIGLTYVSDIVKSNVTSIVLFDDAFDKTCEQLSYGKHVLDHLYAYISHNKVKLIFTMRNTVKHACHRLFSTHKLLQDSVDIDLHSENFRLTEVEKETILTNYCVTNKIMISEEDEDNADQSVSNEAGRHDNEANQSVSDQAVVILKRELMNEIIETDPFLGFPECCRLFTENRNKTHLDTSCFKWPSSVLVNDIEKLRIEGINNYMNGLKYVILIVILTKGYSENQYYLFETNCTLEESNLDEENCKQIFNVCYNMDVEVSKSDIEHVCKVLTERYLVNRDGAYFFQHKAIQDSVLISYSRINPEAIIPLLSFDHLEDIVRPQNYTKQEDEIVIKISKPYYPKLASRIILLCFCSYNQFDRFNESTLITENDTDLVYQLLLGLEKVSYKGCNEIHISGFIQLLLLRNIGKLDDKMLTVKHTKDQQMSISVTIRDKNINLSIHPEYSLVEAYTLKYTDICILLLKSSDHSLLSYSTIFDCLLSNEALGCLQLLLENVKHSKINMTQLLTDLYDNELDNEVDLMLNYVDNSSIDYTKCFDELIEYCRFDKVILILKKVNNRWLNINEVVKQCCKYGFSDGVEWVLQNYDHTLFDYEELFKITIDGIEERFNRDEFDYDDDGIGYSNILELLILQKPGIICCNINQFCDIANKCRMNSVLELLFKHDINKSINVQKIIDDLFQQKDDEEEHDMRVENEDVYEYEEHCQTIIQLIVKYHSNYANVNELIEKAFQFGIHDIVELSLEKLDNISYYLGITLDKLRQQKLKDDIIWFDTGHGKILLLLLPRINYKFIDLNGVMNDVCHIGFSPAVLWLLENNPSYRFDMRNIMNKACYHGDLKHVEYLHQKYNGEDFDYKTAIIKACRNSQNKTLNVCKWLWGNIGRNLFDMKVALKNATIYDNYEVVEWMLTDVDKGLLDIKAAVLSASEHGRYHTLKLLLDKSSINMIDFEQAITLACKNEKCGFKIIKQLYERADKSTVDINAVLSVACKNYRSDSVQWMIETCDQNIIVTETRDRNKYLINSLDKHLLDISLAMNCIVDMNPPKIPTEEVDVTKYNLLCIILKKFHLSAIDVNKLLTESCKKNWLEIFICLLGKVDHSFSNISEAINIACQCGALDIVKWSLQNIDVKMFDIENVMVESCAYGWLECLVLIQKKCFKYAFNLQQSMVEACTYGRIEIVEWLLQNVNYECFHLPLLLQEAGRNGWLNICSSLVNTFQFRTSDLHVATNEALANGHLQIVEWMVSILGRECIEITSLSKNIYLDSGNEAVVKFMLRHFDPKVLDIATVFTNACKFGWRDTTSFIVDNDLCSMSDLSSAFNQACDYGETEIVKLLFEKVDHQILNVKKAMLSAAVKGWDEIAILLLDNIEHIRLDIGNALFEACRHGEIDVVQVILRRAEHNLLDVNTALSKACENHMHGELVLWILENIDQKQIDLKTVKKQAIRHKWRKIQFAILEVDIEDLNESVQGIDTDCIVIS